MMERPFGRLAVLLSLLLLCTAQALAQAPAFGKIPKAKFKPFISPIGNFQVDMPASGWIALAGRGDAVLTLAESRDGVATVVVERQMLRGVLGPGDMGVLASTETRAVTERERGATDVQASVLDVESRQGVAVSYFRIGIKGRESCVSYALPLGEALFRVTGCVMERERPKFAPVFGHIAASLQTPAAAGR